MKQVKRILWIVCLLLVFLIPMSLIVYTSHLEQKQYQPKDFRLELVERAYGAPCKIFRQTVEECYGFDGTFVSGDYLFEEIPGKSVRVSVNTGDEIRPGDWIAYADGVRVAAASHGIVDEILTEDNGVCLRIRSLDTLLLEGQLSVYADLTEGKTYETLSGIRLTPVFLSDIPANGTRLVRFAVEGAEGVLGQTMFCSLLTGISYSNVLCTNRLCVYQKEEGGSYYIRRIEESGKLIGEVEVEVGFANDELICITGAEEGWYADSGYGRYMSYYQ